MSFAKLILEKPHVNSRNATITTPDPERNFTKEITSPAIVPFVATVGELNLILDEQLTQETNNYYLRGVSIPTIMAKEMLDVHRTRGFQKNLQLQYSNTPYNEITKRVTLFDNYTDGVFYRESWGTFKKFLSDDQLFYPFITSIDSSFAGSKKGCDIDKQARAWAKLINDENARVKFIKRFMLPQSKYGAFYLTPPTPMLHRDMQSSIDMCSIISKKAEILAKSWNKPYQLFFNLNGTALRNTSFIKEFQKRLMEENSFGSEFESIAFKFYNEEIHSSSVARKNFSKILNLCVNLRKQNKTTVMHNLDLALGIVAISRGIDIVTSPLSGNTRVKISKNKGGGGFANNWGSWTDPHTFEPLPIYDVDEYLKETSNVFPHSCPACQEMNGNDLKKKVGSHKYNKYRKMHNAYFMGELSQQLRNAIKDDSLTAGVKDWVDRSNYQNYNDLIKNINGRQP